MAIRWLRRWLLGSQARRHDRQAGLPTLISDGTDAFLHGPDGVLASYQATGTSWALHDALGSVRAVTDSAGVVVGTSAYEVFGDVRAATGDTGLFGFTGAQHDPTGLVYLNARYMSPDIGTFLSVDPVRPGAPGVTGYNPYSYTANNPTTWTDPGGTSTEYVGTLQPSLWVGPLLRTLGAFAAKALLAGAFACAMTLGVSRFSPGSSAGVCTVDPPQTTDDPPGGEDPPGPGGGGSDTWKKIVAGLLAGALTLTQISGLDLDGGNLEVRTSYREVDGRKTGSGSKVTRPDFRAKDLRFNPGLSTFEKPDLEFPKPYVIPFSFVVRRPVLPGAVSSPILGLPACTATYTPESGSGHWDVMCAAYDPQQLVYEYSFTNIEVNPSYTTRPVDPPRIPWKEG